MSAPVFIGDELTATAYRLAGLRVLTPPGPQVAEVFQRARREAPLVLISAELSGQLGAGELERALAAGSPPVLVVPDVRRRAPMPDMGGLLRRALGVEG